MNTGLSYDDEQDLKHMQDFPDDMPILPNEPEKVEPFKNALQMVTQTEEELQKFQRTLIIDGFKNIKVSKGNSPIFTTIFELGAQTEKAVKYFDELNSYYVNTTAAQWSRGIFEMLEDIRQAVNTQGVLEFNAWIRTYVNEQTEKAQQNYRVAQENCEILQRDLGL